MKIKNDLISSPKTYTTPQFGCKWDKIAEELQSKPANKIQLSFDEAQKYLEHHGFTTRWATRGSHCLLEKTTTDGKLISILLPCHGHGKPCTKGAIKDIQRISIIA
jgi:predicted RNA binding protein YcfA (HicA-like mRNA interferase family)